MVANALLGFSFPPGTTVLVSLDTPQSSPTSTGRGGQALFPFEGRQSAFQLVINLQISIWAVHIPGQMNVIANLLSHQDQTLPMERSLNPEITKHLLWGSLHVGLFATRCNTKLPTFMSLVPYPKAQVMDTLSLSRQNLELMPFRLISFSPRF